MKKLFSSLSYVLVIISFILVFVSLLLTMTVAKGKASSIFGYSVLLISSESMEPEYPVKTMVLTKQMNINDLKVGNVITFYSKDPEIYNIPVTHRINEVKTNQQGAIYLVTKGDSNIICDKYFVYEEDIIGVVVGSNKLFGQFVSLLSNKWVFFSVIILPLFLVFILSIKDIIKAIKKPKEDDLVEEQDI